ncbi:MAG: condensation domain-containing protein, partial [Ginsengibacter sp.]
IKQEVFNEYRQYWERTFRQLPVLVLGNKETVSDLKANEVSIVYSAKIKNKLKTISQEKNTSLFNLMLTLFAKVITRVSTCNDFLLSVSISGRNLPVEDINNIIGCIAKSLPMRLRLTGSHLTENLREVENSFLEAMEYEDVPPSMFMKIQSENGIHSIFSMYRVFFSYMDFTALETYTSNNLSIERDKCKMYFDSGSVHADLMLGIMVSDMLQINFYGNVSTSFMEVVKCMFSKEIDNLTLTDKTGIDSKQVRGIKIDAALITYFPSLSGLNKLFPERPLSLPKAKSLINTILPGDQPGLLEIETTKFGRTGLVFLPLLGEEVSSANRESLLRQVEKAMKICSAYGAKNISLAGILPSRLNYCISSNFEKFEASGEIMLTTGHSCTVIAVIKTVEKVIAEFNLNLSELKIAVIGYGSIGQASINLLLNKLGAPKSIIISDLTKQLALLKKPITDLKKLFDGDVHVVEVENTIVPEEIYSVDLIIGSSSYGDIIDVEKLVKGSILVDDSFPSIVNNSDAIDRMKKHKDVLIIGAGKLHVGEKRREIIDSVIPSDFINRILLVMGDDGLPGCRIESLLRSFNYLMPATRGVVSNETALAYWDFVEANKLKAVDFHLEGFRVGEDIINNMKSITQQKNGANVAFKK